MQRPLPVLLCAVLLAGCHSGETLLSVPAQFYPSALAFDATRGRFVVGSLQTGEVIAVGRSGVPVATVREADGAPALRVALDADAGAAWILLADRVERRSPDGQLLETFALEAGSHVADLAARSAEEAYALDRRDGAVLRLAPGHPPRAIAHLADLRAPDAAGCAPDPRSARIRDAASDGAIAVLPGMPGLLVAAGGILFHVPSEGGAARRIAIDVPVDGASQLVPFAGDPERRVALLRGGANEIVILALAATLDAARVVEIRRGRVDSPLRAAYDGEALHVLLGGTRHHPALCGDGRPPALHRIARHPLSPVAPDTVAATTRCDAGGAVGRALAWFGGDPEPCRL